MAYVTGDANGDLTVADLIKVTMTSRPEVGGPEGGSSSAGGGMLG